MNATTTMASVISFAEIVLEVIIVSAPWDSSSHRITILALVRVSDIDFYYNRFIFRVALSRNKTQEKIFFFIYNCHGFVDLP